MSFSSLFSSSAAPPVQPSSTGTLPNPSSSVPLASNTASHALPDPDHALPAEQLVSETADLSNVGATGLGGLGSRETAQAKLEKDHERKYEASRPATEPDVVTPGKELPGGWGSTKVEHPSTTIYEDVQTALHGIGKQAFSVLPPSLLDKFSNQSLADDHPVKTTTNTVGHEPTGTAPGAAHSTVDDIKAKASNLYNSLPAASTVIPTSERTTGNKDAVAHEPTATTTGAAHSTVDDIKAKASNLYNSLPAASTVIPTSERTTGNKDAVATSDIPTIAEVKEVMQEEAQHVKDFAVESIGQIKNYFGLGSATVATGSHEIAPALGQKTGEVPLAAVGAEAVQAAHESPATTTSFPASSAAGATGFAATLAPEGSRVGESTPATKSKSAASVPGLAGDEATKDLGSVGALTGAGGLAAVHADEIAHAAELSPATSAGPGASSTVSTLPAGGLASSHADSFTHAPKPSSEIHGGTGAPSAIAAPGTGGLPSGTGGLAAVHADEVAHAAKHSTATSVGSDSPSTAHPARDLTDTHADSFTHAPKPSSEIHGGTGAPSAIAAPGTGGLPSGTGGLAAVHADEIAHAAERSSATSAGTGATTGTSAPSDVLHPAGIDNEYALGKPVVPSASTARDLPSSTAAPASVAPIGATSTTSKETTHAAETPSAAKTLDGEATSASASKSVSGSSALPTAGGTIPDSSAKDNTGAHQTTIPGTSTDGKASPTPAVAPIDPQAKPASGHGPRSSISSNDHTPGSPTSTTSSAHKKKPSFGDKLKGEIKVLSGKLSHDDAKVAAGEKLKHGEL